MAKRSSPSVPIQKLSANLSSAEMQHGIIKLERRIAELKQLDVSQISDGRAPSILALKASIESTLENVFGRNTTDFDRYKDTCQLDKTNYYLMLGLSGNQTFPISVIREGIDKGRNSAVALLEQAVKSIKENLEDSGETTAGKALKAYDGLELHSEISRVVSKLYRDGHYANAVEAAVKVLNGLVRFRSGLEQDGSTLMERAFNPNSPALKFNELLSQSDKDEQKGFMMLFSGAVSGLRNPRAHGFINDDPERALEFIAFVSLLAKLLDDASA